MGDLLSSLTGAITGRSEGLLPRGVADLDRELGERLARAPQRLNEYGFDPYGLHPEQARGPLLLLALLYRYYFRVEAHDIANVPQGRVLLIGNHGGQMPYDGAMAAAAMLLDADPPRICRGMAEHLVSKLPWLSPGAARVGMMVGTPENCSAMLETDECVMAFPEGAAGLNKPFSQRYKLERFGLGFMRLALRSRAPIVPVAVVGAEEQQIGLGSWKAGARATGMPAFPITLNALLLGPIGLVLPLPVKYHLYFGEPLEFEGHPAEEDAAIQARVDVVRRSIEDLTARGLRERRGIFR